MAAGPGAFAQAGIFTDEPKGMFHVNSGNDPKSDPRTEDDVIVTTQGNLSIGSLPTAAADTFSLTLTAGGTPAAPRSPLRIEDGNQQEGRVLTGNANGYATWKDLPAGYSSGRVYGFQGIAGMDLPVAATPVFSYTTDAAGSYLFEIRWWGRYDDRAATNIYTIFRLFKGNESVPKDCFEAYPSCNRDDSTTVTLCLTLYADAAAGDIFTLNVQSTQFVGTSLGQTTRATPAWQQAKVNILRIN